MLFCFELEGKQKGGQKGRQKGGKRGKRMDRRGKRRKKGRKNLDSHALEIFFIQHVKAVYVNLE